MEDHIIDCERVTAKFIAPPTTSHASIAIDDHTILLLVGHTHSPLDLKDSFYTYCSSNFCLALLTLYHARDKCLAKSKC